MIDGENKLCKGCNTIKHVDEFGINKATKDGRSYKCKECLRKYEEKRRRLKGVKKFIPIKIVDNKKQCTLCKEWKDLSEYNKQSHNRIGYQTHCRSCSNIKSKKYDSCPKRRRNRKLKSKYGITNKCYNKMFKKQRGKCKICGSKDTRNSKTNYFAVDHCHKTGKVRGLLCDYCNVGLGRFKDNIESLENAIKYLKETCEKTEKE